MQPKPPRFPAQQDEEQEVPKWTDDMCGWWSLIFLIFACAGLGFGFVLPDLENLVWRCVFSIAVAACVLLALFFLIVVERVDPGVVPPSPYKDPLIALAEVGTVASDLAQDERGQWVRRRLTPTGQSETVERYCSTCNIWRQPRTSHCSKCGYCMERFDHHCGAIGTCVAKKNHRFFVAFLLFSSLGAAVLFTATIWRLREENWGGGPGRRWNDWRTIVLGVLAFVFFYVTMLFFFAVLHCAILVCDFTTKQYIKSRKGGAAVTWPTVEGWLSNINGVCCSEVRNKRSPEVTAPRAPTAQPKGDWGASSSRVAPV